MSVQTPQTEQKQKQKSGSNQVTTPEFRVSFPSVFQARAVSEGGDLKYSVVMLFPKTADLTPLKQSVLAAIIEKWGADKTKWPKTLRLPFRDGTEKDYDGYGPDIIFASATSKMKPGLVDQNVQPILEPSEFYGGCYARATINAFAYDVKGNKGVAFGLRNVQKLRDGEPFSGRNKPEDDFDAIPMPDNGKPAADPLAGIGV